MAPWPEPQGDEPKAPDKSNNNPDDAASSREEGATSRDDPDAKAAASEDQAPTDNVSHLNDGQLRALLDEAISYKSPKDRHGKSPMFNELLKKAETAEEEGGADNSLLFEARYVPPKKRPGGRKDKSVSERHSHSSSLQNLSYPTESANFSSRRHGTHQFRRGASTSSTCSSVTSESVSTRQREGGSLPCSVNEVQGDHFNGSDSSTRVSLEELRRRWDSNTGVNKLLSNKHESPEPTNCIEMMTIESRSSVGGDEVIVNDEEKQRARLQQEKQAVMERASQVVKQETEVAHSVALFRNSVNLEINQKETEDVDRQHTYFKMLSPSKNMCLVQQSESLPLDLPNSTSVHCVLNEKPPFTPLQGKPQKPIMGLTKPATKLHTFQAPSCDDNDNMSGPQNEGGNASSKKKKKKQQHDATVPSEEIAGYVGNKDLDYLIKYIGEDPPPNRSGKVMLTNDLKHKEKEPKHGETTTSRRSHRYSEDGKQKKVGRKGTGDSGGNKMKRSNSLEEVSKTKLENLTIPPYCRSIGGEDRTSEASKDMDYDDEYNRLMDERNGNASVKSEDFQSNLTGSDFPDGCSDSNPTHNEDSQFQMVTNSKKLRRKKQKFRQDDRPGRHSYIRGGGADYEEEHYPLQSLHHHHYPHHHPSGRRKLKSTCSVPPSDVSGGDSSDCDSVHSLPVSHVTASDLATKSYAAIARNPPPPPPPVPTPSAEHKDEGPQVQADETASSSISSTTTEPNTPPEELNVLHDYYPSLAESVKGRGKEGANCGEPAPAPKQQRAAAAPTPSSATVPPPPPPKRVIQNQPAVIFDEKTLCSDSVEGLTFGFSVNPSLMDELGPPAAPVAATPQPPLVPPPPPKTPTTTSAPPSTAPSHAATAAAATAATPSLGHTELSPTSKKTRDFAAMFRPPPQPPAASSYNQYEVITYVGNSWGSIVQELKTKESLNSRSIQYFEC